MSLRRLGALFRRVVQEIRRDRPSLALLFIAPILVTGLLTFILREGQGPAVDAVLVNGMGPAGATVREIVRDTLARFSASFPRTSTSTFATGCCITLRYTA